VARPTRPQENVSDTSDIPCAWLQGPVSTSAPRAPITCPARAEAARAALGALDPARLAAYAPWWAVRAEVAARTGDPAGAAHAWQVAAGLAVDPAERAFLLERRASVVQ